MEQRDRRTAGWRSIVCSVHLMVAKSENPGSEARMPAKSPARGAVWRSRCGLRPLTRAKSVSSGA